MDKCRYVWWAYAAEIIAASTTLYFLCLWLGTSAVINFTRDVALDIATLFGAVMFAAALGFLWTFYSKSDTEFYRWLDTKGAFRVYLSASVYATVVSLMSTLTLVATKRINSEAFTLLADFLLLLAIINLVTLINNVVGLMHLNAKFNQLRANASESE